MLLPARLNPREELVALLRGHAACPILSGLGELGLLDRMLERPFRTADFPEVTDAPLFDATLDYLVSLSLLSRTDESGQWCYAVTPVGKTVFTRYGSCSLIHSYRDFFERLPRMLVGADRSTPPAVDRRVNVLGSGQLHARKFFPSAYAILASHPFRRIIDVGCGNGEFLAGVLRIRPDVEAVGVDVSDVSIRALHDRFRSAVAGVLCDGVDVAGWLRQISPSSEPTVLALWYVVHEFTKDRVECAVDFFRSLHAHLPTAEVILGEIVNIAPEILADNHPASIMPEFLLFHALSGQGVFTWDQHLSVLAQIPYSVTSEVRFDDVTADSGDTIPSSFIWHLRPREQ
jgi:SAM-dependent methyltransferase